MSNYDFDQITDRRNTGSLKWDVAEGELPMWVADMDFQTAPAVREAIEKRAAHGVFGYTDVEEDWYQAYMDWWESTFKPAVFAQKIPFGNFSPEKTLRYRRPSCVNGRDLASEATYDA